MAEEYRSKILAEVNKVVVGGLFALLAASVTGAYVVRHEMETAFREHSRRLESIRQQGEAVHAVVQEVSPAVAASADRAMRVALLDLRRGPSSINRTAADHWHNVSAKARSAAASDVGSLAYFSQGLPPAGEAIRRHVEELLRAEIAIWEQIDRFVEQKARGQDDEEQFRALDRALLEYRRLVQGHAKVLLGAGGGFFRSGAADNEETMRSFQEAMGRTRAKFKWSVVGIVAAFLGLVSYCLYFLWPRLRSKPPERKIITPGY